MRRRRMNISESFPARDLCKHDHQSIRRAERWEVIYLRSPVQTLRRMRKLVRTPRRMICVRVRMGGWTEFYATMFPASSGSSINVGSISRGRKGESGILTLLGSRKLFKEALMEV